jgi:hypothetical protein
MPASDDDDAAFAATECLETIATVVEVKYISYLFMCFVPNNNDV